MFTLLPEKDMEIITREYRMRITAVSLVLLVIATVLAMVLLMPSFVLISSRQKIVTEKLSAITESQKKLLAGDPEIVARDSKELMATVSTRLKSIRFSEIFDRIIDHRTTGVRITSLNASIHDGLPTIVVSGVASTRQTLSAFVKKLEADNAFSSISIPVSNFTKATNLEFAVSVVTKSLAL